MSDKLTTVSLLPLVKCMCFGDAELLDSLRLVNSLF